MALPDGRGAAPAPERPGAERPRLSVVVVSWNTWDLLRDCLASLRRCEGASFEILVVDNASTDGSPDRVAGEFSEVRLIRNAENLGFSRANNLGIAQARGDYVLLLNSDTVVEDPRLLARWLAYMDAHPGTAASGCRLVYPDGRHQVGDAGYRPGLRTLVNHFLFLSRLSLRLFPPIYLSYRHLSRPLAVDWVCGAAFLVRREVVDEVGGLDEDVFMFAEDIEWGCRMREHGHRVVYLPDLEVVHLQGGSSARREEAGFSTLWLANLRRLYFRYHPRQPYLVYDLVVATGLALRVGLYGLVYAATRGRFAGRRVRGLSGYLRCTLAGLGRPRGPAADGTPR